ncbi:MAG: TonB family protein [Bacteroidetes bacterium]|nr:TonB family protein [Bacteroidota bacterium]
MAGSIIITGLLMLLLFLIVMPGTKKPEDEGIMVSFGDADDGAGVVEEPVTKPVEETYTPPASTPKPVKQTLMTQDDNSVALAEQKKKEKQERDAIEQMKKEQARIAAEKKRKEQEAVDKANAMNGLFGNGGSQGSGTTTGTSTQGNPAGKGTSGGNSWSLNGRSLNGRLVSPSYDNDVEGKVTVNIRVDASGNVLSASIGSPTTISDSQMRNAAIEAAKNTRFTSGNGVATGTITYNFKLR